MYNMLIVDDELSILEWVYELSIGIEDIYLNIHKASSGSEALECLNKTRIDIVITDIRMPGISGLQLLEIIKVNWPESKVIFLTGYDEFDYIYTATKHDGVSYLLKTEGDEEIIKAIHKAISEIEKNLEVNGLAIRNREQIKKALPLLQREFLLELMQCQNTYNKVSQRQLDDLEMDLKADESVLLIICRIDNLPAIITSIEKTQMFYDVILIIEKFLGRYIVNCNLLLEQGNLLCIIQPNNNCRKEFNTQSESDLWDRLILFIKGTLETIQAVCKRSLKYSISFVLDNKPSQWNKISDNFNIINMLINYKVGQGTEMLLVNKEFNNININTVVNQNDIVQQIQIKLKKIRILKNYLECGQREEFINLMNELTDCLVKIDKTYSSIALEICYSISIVLISYINKWNLEEKLKDKIDLRRLFSVPIYEGKSNLIEFFYKLSHVLFDIQKWQQERRASDAIGIIEKYINEHLGEDLSLIILSEQVYLNASYLSRLFKQVTGNNLSHYIYNCKIEKAKQLLNENKLKINEIALSVGYESPTYFTHFFKKNTNMSPQAYREHCRNR